MSFVEEHKEDASFNKQQAKFSDTFLQAILGAQLCQTAYIGHKLGWYKALKEHTDAGGLTYPELAAKTETSPRYAKEWLEQQAVAQWIHCPNPSAPEKTRRFLLPHAHASILADPDSLNYMAPLTVLLGGTAKVLDQLVDAYKNDTGVSWEAMGNDARCAVAELNRPFYLQQLGSVMEGILGEDVASRLNSRGGRIADIGAGCAWSSIGVAKHFRAATVDAFDLDGPSVALGETNIRDHGVDDRVKIYCKDASECVEEDFEYYDLVMALECIHDLSNPISVLRTMRKLAGENGTVVVMDERVADDFSTTQDPIEQLCYGFSCVCCLADSKSRPRSAATGTVMRPKVLRAYAQQAGFKDMEILPVDNDFFRFYKLIG